MKKSLIAFIVLLFCSPAFGAFLVCDPQATVTKYQVNIAGQTLEVPAQTDGSLKFDISPYSGNNITGSVKSGREWTLDSVPSGVWEWSDPRPFVLSGGKFSGSPSGLRIER